MRVQYEFSQRNLPNSTTPRAKQKPNIPIDTSRRSTIQNLSKTPSKIKQRISSSPLRVPLEKAINKVARERQKSFDRGSQGQSRCLGRSSRRQDSSIISMAKKLYYDEQPQKQMIQAHSETLKFLRKYFNPNVKQIPVDIFIQRIMEGYQSLWGTNNVGKIIDDLTYKITDIFGDSVNVQELTRISRQDGMIGLILRIFKEIKTQQNTRNSNYISFSQNPQVMSLNKSFEDRLTDNDNIAGIKNVVQQFMETMYQCMENQIYNKFNVQMRRMVVKYRESERLLKKINEKLTTYADVFDIQKKMKEKQRLSQATINQLRKEKEKLASELTKERDNCWNQKRQRDKLLEENTRIKENLDKYQNAIFNKALQNTYTQPSLSRHVSGQSRVLDKTTTQNMGNSQINQNQQPFKITIDTHYVHKETGPPQTRTYTTLHNPPTVSPSRRDSKDHHHPPLGPSNFSVNPSSVSPIKPYSPYTSRVSRQY